MAPTSATIVAVAPESAMTSSLVAFIRQTLVLTQAATMELRTPVSH